MLAPYLVLLLQNLGRVVLLVRDVDALQAVDVPGQTALVDVSLAGVDGLVQGVVDEDVLLLGLDEVVALAADVLEKGEDVDVTAGLDLPHHRVQADVAARSAHSGAEKRTKNEELTTELNWGRL